MIFTRRDVELGEKARSEAQLVSVMDKGKLAKQYLDKLNRR
jgi:hypothetical protein